MTRRDFSEDEHYYTQAFERDGVVSVWLELDKPDQEADVDALQSCCGVGYYNIDNQEANHLDARVSLDRLFADVSYSESFAPAAIDRAKELGIDSAYWLLVQFDFAYDPSKVSRPPTGELVFLGVFPYATCAA
ncbi:hypothetical protein ACFFGH_34300 [Lysobacter korlensis]|uniref:Uncharacterized protein n=1 Tax=Lysobacter korlensis TaxID=553636 RepID=A0ABV6S477_9GAMM